MLLKVRRIGTCEPKPSSDIIPTQLAGVDDDAISEDYSLTRIGREPIRDQVMERLSKVPLFAADNEKALNMLTSRYIPIYYSYLKQL